MKVIVGSQNPVKVNAVKRAFAQYFQDFTIEGINSSSKVRKQPMTVEESYQGAYNRAQAGLALGADYGVGLEGGLETYSFGVTTCGVMVIIDRKGTSSFGMSARLSLPDRYVSELRRGKKELGDLIVEDSGIENLKQKGGMFGLFTNDVLPREDAYYQGVVFALARFINKKYY